MSSSSASTGHGGGNGWVFPLVVLGYALVAFLAWALGDFSPWVFIIGTLAPIGIAWAAWHLGHVVGHLFHSVGVHGIIFVLGVVFAGVAFMPVWEWRDTLSPEEVRVYMWGGAIGIVFLALELGHMLHDHSQQAIIGVGTAALLIGLWIGRPEGARFLDEAPSYPSVTLPSIPPGPTLTQTFPPQEPPPSDTAEPSSPPPAAPAAPKAKYSGPPVPKKNLPDMFGGG